jgi:hypothetical protein
MSVVLGQGCFGMVNVFQVLSVVAVMALAAAVKGYPGYAHHGFYPLSAPSHEHEYHVSTLMFYGTHSFIEIAVLFLYTCWTRV